MRPNHTAEHVPKKPGDKSGWTINDELRADAATRLKAALNAVDPSGWRKVDVKLTRLIDKYARKPGDKMVTKVGGRKWMSMNMVFGDSLTSMQGSLVTRHLTMPKMVECTLAQNVSLEGTSIICHPKE